MNVVTVSVERGASGGDTYRNVIEARKQKLTRTYLH